MAEQHDNAPSPWTQFSTAYYIADDASAENLLDDAVTLLDYAYSMANAMSHSITERTEMDNHHMAGTFAAIATFIDMAQSSSSHAQVQWRRMREEAERQVAIDGRSKAGKRATAAGE